MTTKAKTYRVGNTYRFHFEMASSELVTYLGKTHGGMYRFLFSTGEVWTGYTAPVTVDAK